MRAVIKSRDKPVVEQLLDATGIESASALFSVMLSRYGRHMAETWELAPVSAPIQETRPTGGAPTKTRADDDEMFI